MSAIGSEQRYVKAESKKPHGPYLADAYADVDEEEEEYGSPQIIDNALYEYYSERGLPVPNWKKDKNPDWWKEYLIEMGLDPRNP